MESKEPHPLIQGLMDALPPLGWAWPEEHRKKWLEAAAKIFWLLYDCPQVEAQEQAEKEPVAIKITPQPPKLPDRKCLDCNADMSDRHPTAKRCGPCTVIRNREHSRKHYEKKKKGAPAKRPPAKKKVSAGVTASDAEETLTKAADSVADAFSGKTQKHCVKCGMPIPPDIGPWCKDCLGG